MAKPCTHLVEGNSVGCWGQQLIRGQHRHASTHLIDRCNQLSQIFQLCFPMGAKGLNYTNRLTKHKLLATGSNPNFYCNICNAFQKIGSMGSADECINFYSRIRQHRSDAKDHRNSILVLSIAYITVSVYVEKFCRNCLCTCPWRLPLSSNSLSNFRPLSHKQQMALPFWAAVVKHLWNEGDN